MFSIKHKDILKICTTKYFGKILSPEQRFKAEDLLSTMYPEMIPTYLSFWRRLTLSPIKISRRSTTSIFNSLVEKFNWK